MEHLDAQNHVEDLPPIYYMRDNHTFRRLSNDVDEALDEIAFELNAGYTSGSLFTKRDGVESLGFRYTTPRYQMLSMAREWLDGEIAARKAISATVVEVANVAPVLTRDDSFDCTGNSSEPIRSTGLYSDRERVEALLRGLEAGVELADASPDFLYKLAEACATQAKKAPDASPR